MHHVEPGEQAPDEAGPLPGRRRAIELPDRRSSGFECIEDVVHRRETRNCRPEAWAPLGVQFENPGVQA